MIYINEKLRIKKLDERCLQIEEYRAVVNAKTKEESFAWKWCGYYGDLRTACLGALSKIMVDYADEELTLKEVLAKIDEARNQIEKAVRNAN